MTSAANQPEDASTFAQITPEVIGTRSGELLAPCGGPSSCPRPTETCQRLSNRVSSVGRRFPGDACDVRRAAFLGGCRTTQPREIHLVGFRRVDREWNPRKSLRHACQGRFFSRSLQEHHPGSDHRAGQQALDVACHGCAGLARNRADRPIGATLAYTWMPMPFDVSPCLNFACTLSVSP